MEPEPNRSPESCKRCNQPIFEIDISIILDRGIFRNEVDGIDLPEKWVEGIVKCWCGAENEVIRIEE